MKSLARKKGVVLLVSLVVISNVAFAQGDEKALDPIWVANDVKSVKFVLGLIPIERRKIEDIEKQFKEFPHKYTSWKDETNLGFGGKRVKLSMGVGYTTLSIDYLLFNDRIVRYAVGARVSGGKWNFHGKTIARAWREAGGPEFTIDNGELYSAKEFPEVWQSYRSEIESQLGAIQPIDVPPALVKHYQLLTDRLVNSRT